MWPDISAKAVQMRQDRQIDVNEVKGRGEKTERARKSTLSFVFSFTSRVPVTAMTGVT